MIRTASAALPLLLIAACGCSTFSKSNPFGDRIVRADEKNPAVEVACIWQPGEGRNTKGVPARGFSGQIFFFTGRDSQPALVDGTMRVYLFADRGTPEERAKPLKEYDFTPETWALHATRTSLGPGYTVFIPYPQSEFYQVRCQLRARFVPRLRPAIWSEAVTMTLEGPPQPRDEAPSLASNRDAAPLPTVDGPSITHRSVAASELDLSDQPAGRQLRTDTFQLGAIKPASYETPVTKSSSRARKVELDELDSETLQGMLKDVSRSKSTRPHPLDLTGRRSSKATPTTAEDAATEGEPGPRMLLGRPTQPHPLAKSSLRRSGETIGRNASNRQAKREQKSSDIEVDELLSGLQEAADAEAPIRK